MQSEACAVVTAPPKSRDMDWVIIVLLLISEASRLRRGQVKTLTPTFPLRSQQQVYIGETWGFERGKFLRELRGEPGSFFPSSLPLFWCYLSIHISIALFPQVSVIYGHQSFVFSG